MISLQEIEQALVQSDSKDLPLNFAAAAVQIQKDSGTATHAGIIIRHEELYYLFHFNGTLILENTPQGQWYFHKNFIFVKDAMTGIFLAHCKNIRKHASPVYGYFYPGSYYDNQGNYFSEIEMPEYMTCVGFCLNVIKGFIEEEEYINFNDWDRHSISNPDYITRLIEEFKNKYPNISSTKLIEHIRRISPAEYLASAYFDQFPISKQNIDSILFNVNEAIYLKATA